MAVVDRIRMLVEPPLEKLGYELVRVQLMGGGGRTTLQIMAERKDDLPMKVEDCEAISNALSALLDEADPISAHYILEVSSPGIDRPLTRLKDFSRFSGFEAKIQLRNAVNGQRNFSGKLAGVDGQMIGLDMPAGKKTEAQKISFLFDDVESARLIMTDELLKASAEKAG